VIAQHRAATEPGKGHTGTLTEFLGDAEAGKLLLRLADIEHALFSTEPLQELLGDLILALALGKRDDLDALALGKVVDRLDEGPAHRAHQSCGGHLGSAMALEESRHPRAGLQHGLVQIQIHPIDPFNIQRHFLCEQITDGMSYDECRPRLTSWLYATPPLRAATNGSIAFRRSTGASVNPLTSRRSEA
jgi:hypothetical protein